MRWLPKVTVGGVAVLAIIAAGLALYLVEPVALQGVRHAVFDQYQRWYPRPYAAAPVRIVDLNDDSLARVGQWPWPRTLVADLIRKLQDAGAVVIGFDVVFAEADRTSPQSMAALWHADGVVGEKLRALPDHDQVMAQALQRGGVVLGFAGERGGAPTRLPARAFRVVNVGEPALPYLHVFSGAVTSLEVLESAAAGSGLLNFLPDSDGVVRRVPLLVRVGDEVMPSLTTESLRVGFKQRNFFVRTVARKGVGLQDVRVGDVTVPTTVNGEMWVHYTRPVAERTIAAWQVLGGQVAPGSLVGHVVLVGTSAKGLMDLRPNPLGTIMPGVEAHAQALEQILTGKYLERPHWALAIEALVLVLGALLIGVAALTSRAMVSAAVTVMALAAIGGAAWLAFYRYGLLLDPVTPSLVLLLTFLIGSITQHINSEREQRWLRTAFSRYVSPNRVDYLVKNPGQLELGGRRQECSFVFTDLENFTSMMEKMDPGEAVSLLNAYLDRMIAIVFECGGTLDRIVGDAVVVMFSAPQVQADHRARAYRCALAMHAFASVYSAELEAKGTPFGKTRIGIHTGEVIVGNFGGSAMFDYRALGDAVNTAARLESVNKHLGTTVCVSEETLSGCPGALVRPVGRLVLKGKTQALMAYEPLITTARAATERDTAYEAAFELLHQGSPQALDAFEQLARAREHDPLVHLHLGRLRAGAHDDLMVLDEK